MCPWLATLTNILSHDLDSQTSWLTNVTIVLILDHPDTSQSSWFSIILILTIVLNKSLEVLKLNKNSWNHYQSPTSWLSPVSEVGHFDPTDQRELMLNRRPNSCFRWRNLCQVLAIIAGCTVKEAVADGRSMSLSCPSLCTGLARTRGRSSGVSQTRTTSCLAFRSLCSWRSSDMSCITMTRFENAVVVMFWMHGLIITHKHEWAYLQF